jgi:hypothetical protein
MYDQRSTHGPGGTQVQRASAAGTPGKTTLTEQLNGGAEPVATAASHRHKKKDLLEKLHEALKKAGETIADKVKDKLAEEPEKLLDKLLKKLETKADDTIKDGLGDGAKSCLSQAEIDHVVAAINTTRLIAGFHVLHGLDKAVLAERASLHDKDESIVNKAKDLFHNVGDALDALGKFSDAMDRANRQIHQLHGVVARCKARPVPRVNPQLKPFTVPRPQDVPEQLHLPPDVVHHKPSFHIQIGPLGGVQIGSG